jgi:hypothetical protein
MQVLQRGEQCKILCNSNQSNYRFSDMERFPYKGIPKPLQLKYTIPKILLFILNLSKTNSNNKIKLYYLIDFEQFEELLHAVLYRTHLI